MDALNRPRMGGASRRDFLKGIAGLSAASLLLPRGVTTAQNQTGSARRIDVHQHYASPNYWSFLDRKNSAGITVTSLNQFRDYTPQRNLDAMDMAGVQTAMISPTAPGVWFGDGEEARAAAREINEWAVAKMVDTYKGRFGLFASLPIPDVDRTLREIEYAYDTLKADGVCMLTSYDDIWLGDKRLDPVFDELNRRQAVVYTHPLEADCCKNPLAGVGPTTLEYPTDTTRAIMNLIVSNTATRCPNIKFIFSHAGGTLVSIAQRFLGNQVTADALTKPVEANSRLAHVRRFYYDTAGSANPIQLQSLKLLVPTSQIVFGSDFPFGNVGTTAAGVQSSGLSPSELQGVFRDNAAKFLPRFAS